MFELIDLATGHAYGLFTLDGCALRAADLLFTDAGVSGLLRLACAPLGGF